MMIYTDVLCMSLNYVCVLKERHSHTYLCVYLSVCERVCVIAESRFPQMFPLTFDPTVEVKP